jgi:hypothetical protein
MKFEVSYFDKNFGQAKFKNLKCGNSYIFLFGKLWLQNIIIFAKKMLKNSQKLYFFNVLKVAAHLWI